MARLLRFVAVAALVGGATAVLSACSDSVDPVVSESPSVPVVVTPSPTVSPTPTALTDEELLELIPEDARGADFQSASNFAKFFIGEYQRMLVERDSSLFEFLSEPDCIFCGSSLQTYAELVASGDSIEGGQISTDSALALGEVQADGSSIATIRIETGAQTRRDAAGSVLEQVPSRSGLVSVQMHQVDGHWRVIDVNLQPDTTS